MLKTKKTNRKDLLSALFYCLRMVFVQTTKQICRDRLQRVQSLPVLRSSVEERWWKISYIWSFRSPENFGLVGRSGELGWIGEQDLISVCYTDKRNRKPLGWQGSEGLEWSCLHFPPPFTAHGLKSLQTHCRLTSRWVLQDSGPALPGARVSPTQQGTRELPKLHFYLQKTQHPEYFLCSHTYQ